MRRSISAATSGLMFEAEPALEGELALEEELSWECTSRSGSMNPILGPFGVPVKILFLKQRAAFVKSDCSKSSFPESSLAVSRADPRRSRQ
jgi:hypothetical protein